MNMFKATLKGITRAVSGNGAINQDEGQGAQRGLLMHRQGLETHTFMFHPNTSPARSRQLIERENITFTC